MDSRSAFSSAFSSLTLIDQIERPIKKKKKKTVMAAFGTKVVVLMMVLPSLLLLQTSSVEAVDILIYSENDCLGTVQLECLDVAANTCCYFNGRPAVQIKNLLNGQTGNLFTGGECTTRIILEDGPNAGECYYNVTYSGATWVYT